MAWLQVIVVANPANTNALILKENAPKVKDENITCMTRLDHNRALGQVSQPYRVFWMTMSSPCIETSSGKSCATAREALGQGSPVSQKSRACSCSQLLDQLFWTKTGRCG